MVPALKTWCVPNNLGVALQNRARSGFRLRHSDLQVVTCKRRFMSVYGFEDTRICTDHVRSADLE